MKLALIGATGFVGGALLAEALKRGHDVTALARTPAKIAAQPRLAVTQADVLDAAQVAAAVAGHDAVLSAYNPGWKNPDLYAEFLRGTRAIVDGVKRSGVKRLLLVGGAGSLYAAPGVQLVDTPQFPAEWKQGALAARDALEMMRKEDVLDWSFVSPAVILEPGPSRGGFRLGGDEPLLEPDGKPAHLTVGDLAVAILDEIETPRHVRQRFTAAY